MKPSELQIFQDTAWDSGWHAALTVVMSMLRSPILRADVKPAEIADDLEEMKVGYCVNPKVNQEKP